MSTVLESIGRGARGLVDRASGITESPSSAELHQAQELRGNEMIKKLTTGGLALGGGVGLLVALRNQLKTLREEAEASDDRRLDDDTLYIPTGQKKEAANRWLAPGLAVTGGVLGMGGAYALVQEINDRIVRSRRRKQLDAAQADTLRKVDEEAEVAKAASGVNMTAADIILAFPVATALLTAGAAGAVTYGTLNKSFPVVKKPNDAKPKRIRLLSSDGTVLDPDTTPIDEEALAKAASFDDLDDAGLEFLVHTVSAGRPDGITADFLRKAAGIGGLDEMEALLNDGGVDALVEGCRSLEVPSNDRAAAAAMGLSKSASLRPTVQLVAACELLDMIPNVAKLTSAEATLEKMAHVGALLGLALREPASDLLEKSAFATPVPGTQRTEIMETIKKSLNGPQVESNDAGALVSDVSGGMADDSEENADAEPLKDKSDMADAAFGA